MSQQESSPDEDVRFEFGKNWQRFLATLNDDRIQQAASDLSSMLVRTDLTGLRFLDVGSGSGLSSLAARQLGARVHSFDYDTESVACTKELRRRYSPDEAAWTIEQASILDREHMKALGTFDVVYAWGVLHHTGAMWEAMDNAGARVGPGGTLFVALYNDQGRRSRMWRVLKRLYVRGPAALRPALVMIPFAIFSLPRMVLDTLQGSPLRTWRQYWKTRGMSAWHDLVDWAGGYPFEVATPGEVVDFYRRRGFVLDRLVSTVGSGCNEFVFTRDPQFAS